MKQFCSQGHDVFICGRYKNGHCRLCQNEYYKRYYLDHQEKRAARNSQYYQDHKQEKAKYNKQWCDNNRGKVAQYQIKNKTNRNLRIPKFGQDGIVEFYDNRPEGYEVDHIVPLQGKLVSGLHVSWNLRYLTPHDNRVKYNLLTESQNA
ncbi:MAG: HNH endonuclease signature motif containing protein [bacterium]